MPWTTPWCGWAHEIGFACRKPHGAARPIDDEVARVSGLLARRHRRSNTGIDDADYLIAGTAIVLDAELLTTNVRHFPMLTGLRSPY